MRRLALALTALLLITMSSAETLFEGEGSWIVVRYSDNMVLTIAADVLRPEGQETGASPMVMINAVDEEDACYFSLGLLMAKEELPRAMRDQQEVIEGFLGRLIDNSEVWVNGQRVMRTPERSQTLYMEGIETYMSRRMISLDELLALISGDFAQFEEVTEGWRILFSLDGLESTIKTLSEEYCFPLI